MIRPLAKPDENLDVFGQTEAPKSQAWTKKGRADTWIKSHSPYHFFNVLYHGYGGGPAGGGNELPGDAERHASRRRLYGRPEKSPGCQALRDLKLS